MIRTRVRTDHSDRSGRAGALGAVRPGDGRDGPERYYRVEAGDTLWSIAVVALRRRPARRSLGAAAAESAHGHHDPTRATARAPAVGAVFDRPDGARRAYDRVPARKETNGERAHPRAAATARRRRRVPRDPGALEEALDRRGQPRPAWAHLDAHRGLCLRGRRHRGALGGTRRRGAVLHRAADGIPRHPFRPRVHRDRASGRVRRGSGDGHAQRAVARARADGRAARVAQRHLLPVGPGARLFRGEMVYTDLAL